MKPPGSSDAARAATPTASEPTLTKKVGSPIMTQEADCKHCTVPTTEGDVCAFCSSYTAPVDDALADAVSHTAAAIAAAAETLDHLPADAPLFGAVDVVNALAHLRKAASRLDRVGRALAVQQVAGGAQ